MKFRIAGHEIDTERHTFRAGGEPVRLEPQVFDLIVLLAGNPGRLVSRDELVATIWRGRVVSDSTIDARIAAARKALGDDGARQAVIATVPRRGIRLVAPVEQLETGQEPSATGQEPPATGQAPSATGQAPAQDDRAPAAHSPRANGAAQRIRFTRSRDGTRIAWARTGEGPPLLRAGLFLGHLEQEQNSPVWGPVYQRLNASFSLVRYDQRGFGLSDRDPARLELEDYIDDLEAVADAAGFDRFALLGLSQGAAIAVGFAARRPERVSRLVLVGGFVQGRMVRPSEEERARAAAVLAMIREGWGDPEGPFLQAFATLYMPDATPEQLLSIVGLQRAAATPEMAVRIRDAIDHFDVSDRLERIEAPTLVVHANRDAVHPFAQGLRLAERLPRAELMAIESRNHAPLPQDQEWRAAWDAVEKFVLARPERAA